MLFSDWQKTCKEISLQELEDLFPGTLKNFGYEESPPRKIFLYEGDAWIVQCGDNIGSYYSLHIESITYTCLQISPLETRLFDWCLDKETNSK